MKIDLKGQHTQCDINQTLLPSADYFMTRDNMPERNDTGNTDSVVRRRRWSNVTDFEKWQSAETDVPSNRTMFINCTNEDSSSLCQQVYCHAGPLFTHLDIANISIKMNIKSKELG